LLTIGQRPVFQPADETLQALFSQSFDPRTTVYLPLEASAAVHAAGNSNARIISQSFSAEKITLEVETDSPALIVMAQSYHRGWKAFVDR